MRAGKLLAPFLAALLLVFSFTLPSAKASILAAKPSLHRRLLYDSTSLDSSKVHGRQLLQSCDSCPALASARRTCSAASASQLNTIRADLISKCGSVSFNPTSCCELYTSGNWNTYAACACSDTIAGLSAFVDGSAVMSACGCGPGAASTTTVPSFLGRTSSSNESGSTSSTIDMATVYSAVSFSNGNDNSNSNSAGSSSSSSSNSSSNTNVGNSNAGSGSSSSSSSSANSASRLAGTTGP